ncbi:Fanconi anemia group A protein-like [Amphiura filiformis]|uniref:Fanconi anemia group A protein-like n=1 Tax=Amphiura filiformis TaxID=82378 RepID=UPI003B21BCF2
MNSRFKPFRARNLLSSQSEMDTQKLHHHSKKLKDVLANRKLHKRPLSGGSKTLLREAVLQLIDHHQQLDLLIKESSSLQNSSRNVIPSEVNKDDTISHTHGQFSVDSCISYLKAQAQAAGIPLATLAANVCVAKLSEVLQQYEPTKCPYFDKEAKNAVESILDIVAALKETHSFDRIQFVKELNAKGPLPLELLWRLHVKSIMTFDLFITSNLGQSQAFTTFTSDVGRCLLKCVEEEQEICTDIMKDISQFLIANGYGSRIEVEESSSSATAVQKACVVLLDTICEKILDNPGAKGPTALAKLLALIRNNSCLPNKCLIKFSSHLLVLVLSHKAHITVKDAIGTQEQWSFGRAPSGVTSMYRELLLAMECKDAMDVIHRVLEREEVNWKSLLTFSSTLLVCFQKAPQMMKDMIDKLLNQSLESCEQDGLIAAFLLARQAANEGPHVFQSYPQWFRDHFGEGASCLSNKKTVAFFLAFLTSLVPHEPAEYLKAHLKNQPHVPTKSRESLADYNSLAKTRLADLKVPLESEGIYSSTSTGSIGMKQSGKTQMQDQAMEDVEKSVAAYERTSKMPTNVMEASIFRRPYYIGRFLPALLTPRLLPDVPDSKMKFIEELKCADKIPASMLQNYEDACAKEASSLLEGAFTDDAFDDCLEPIDSLNVSLEKLPSAVLGSLQSQNASANGIAQHISIISDRLSTVLDSITQLLGEHNVGLDADCVILDLDKSTHNIHAQHMQVVDMIIDSFCKTCLAVKSSNNHLDTGSRNALWSRSNALWASQLVAMVSKHRSMIGALYHRLWNLALEQGNTLSTPHIHGIAVFLVHLQVNQQLFPPVFISGGATNQQSDGSLLHHISRYLPHHNAQRMQFSVQFTSEVIDYTQRYARGSSENQQENNLSVIPADVVKKFYHLLLRVCPDVRQCASDGLSCKRHRVIGAVWWTAAFELYHNKQTQDLIQQYKQVTFQEWLLMELQVEPYNDGMTAIERQDYYRWAVHNHFLSKSTQDGGCGGSYKHACSLILETLLDHDIKSSLLSNRKLCCHGSKGAEAVRKGQNGCRGELIQLLQDPKLIE